MVLLACETDFVSKNEEFITLAKDIAMHVAATDPTYINKDELPTEAINKAKEVFAADVVDKPAEMQEKIMDGKLASYFKDQILMEQDFIQEPRHNYWSDGFWCRTKVWRKCVNCTNLPTGVKIDKWLLCY